MQKAVVAAEYQQRAQAPPPHRTRSHDTRRPRCLMRLPAAGACGALDAQTAATNGSLSMYDGHAASRRFCGNDSAVRARVQAGVSNLRGIGRPRALYVPAFPSGTAVATSAAWLPALRVLAAVCAVRSLRSPLASVLITVAATVGVAHAMSACCDECHPVIGCEEQPAESKQLSADFFLDPSCDCQTREAEEGGEMWTYYWNCRCRRVFPPWRANVASWPALATAVAATVVSQAMAVTSIAKPPGSNGGWYGGILAPNGAIYGVPHNSIYILKVVPRPAPSASLLAGSTGGYTSGGWAGGVLASTGLIYFFPYNAPQVLRIDPANDTFALIGPNISGLSKWAGGAMAANGVGGT